ncbi:gem-associated protein 6 [Tribolium castaneum]|uniref:AD domain-containing protein n=1 Tax=Tribolium castaneum TaxID=7070 RepID=D6WE89_TRICA|nr:PREDICTED: gem-associated protein 6 [Tribolium castaneum]EEZ99905.1 hypothetical protein TcasGA2_TC002690 [Tribolium castaneum]|eukprot:XP_975819.1 PREDICTED: gem-associated protein 6 [Tribolium castaneum]
MDQIFAKEDPIFNNDVLYMKSLIGKSVNIETVDKCTHVGVVYVVDPVYKTVVLLNKSTKSLEFVLYPAIKSFNVVSDVQNDELLQTPTKLLNSEESLHLKMKLMKWLKLLMINVREDGELLKVDEHLSIGPPYGADDCMCDNTIVLERIRKIIGLMPPEFE